jgi:hypothetical protein
VVELDGGRARLVIPYGGGVFFLYILPEEGHQSGPKHVVVVHNKIEHEKYFVTYGGSN